MCLCMPITLHTMPIPVEESTTTQRHLVSKTMPAQTPTVRESSSWAGAQHFKADDQSLSVVQLQSIDGTPRTVCSGPLPDGAAKPATWLGPDPTLAGKYALLEATTTAVQTALAAEAIGIGLKSGLDARIIYDAIAGAAGSSW
jgi:hypothetical protein